MVYTVKKLSVLSGVTIRALYYYEEEGLLKPSYYGSNGYRYYEEKQLLQLQQILFFKELGFTIKQMKSVIDKKDFDQLSALCSHRKSLQKNWEKIGQLIDTIDQTIKHLKGKIKMKDEEIFDGFNISLVKKAPRGASYSAAEEVVFKSVRNPTTDLKSVEKRGKTYYENLKNSAETLFKDLVSCLEREVPPNGAEAQRIIKKHHTLIDQVQRATKQVYLAMAQLYHEHPKFKNQLDPFHPDLAKYISEAMQFFADNNLK